MPRATPLAAHVAKTVSNAPSKDIAGALKALVIARLRKPARTTQTPHWPKPWDFGDVPAKAGVRGMGGHRRSPRRLGKVRFYKATAMPDVSRYGTFRRYMISTIRAHNDTRSANAAHALCDDPKFAKNKLDFNWAADNGYITWE
jgi:hypothetical protein